MISTIPSNKAIVKLFILLICLFAFAHDADAAYKTRLPRADRPGNIIAGKSAEQHMRPRTHWDDEPKGAKGASIWDNKEGIISIVAGISAATLAVLALLLIIDLSPVIAILGISSAIVAIISGAIGRRQRPRGFAIAGLSLGIAVLAGAITLGLLILLILLIL